MDILQSLLLAFDNKTVNFFRCTCKYNLRGVAYIETKEEYWRLRIVKLLEFSVTERKLGAKWQGMYLSLVSNQYGPEDWSQHMINAAFANYDEITDVLLERLSSSPLITHKLATSVFNVTIRNSHGGSDTTVFIPNGSLVLYAGCPVIRVLTQTIFLDRPFQDPTLYGSELYTIGAIADDVAFLKYLIDDPVPPNKKFNLNYLTTSADHPDYLTAIALNRSINVFEYVLTHPLLTVETFDRLTQACINVINLPYVATLLIDKRYGTQRRTNILRLLEEATLQKNRVDVAEFLLDWKPLLNLDVFIRGIVNCNSKQVFSFLLTRPEF